MKHPNLIDKYDVSPVKKNIPIKPGPSTGVRVDSRGNATPTYAYKEYSSHDYLNFIAKNKQWSNRNWSKITPRINRVLHLLSPWGTSKDALGNH